MIRLLGAVVTTAILAGCGPPEGARLEIRVKGGSASPGTTEIGVVVAPESGTRWPREASYRDDRDPFVFQVLVPTSDSDGTVTVEERSTDVDDIQRATGSCVVDGDVPLDGGLPVVIWVNRFDGGPCWQGE